MKKTGIFLLVVFFTLSCSKERSPEVFDLELESTFQIGGVYLSQDNLLKFKIDEINDSRCPGDVTCI
ncbi:MAG: hypothetical protein J7L95_04255 [Prolixibacteraceae bacterium]|nr:hypothetical protein [Prolixibacteraceae bacterium]